MQLNNSNNLPRSDEQDFRRIFEAHQHRVFNTALGLVQNREDAEDIAQEVFVTAYEGLANFRGEAQVSTWLYRITVNRSLDFLKAKKAKKRSGFVLSIFGDKKEDDFRPLDIPDFVHPGIQMERKEQAVLLFKAINQLPEQQKIAFTLSKVECLSYVEIAEIMQTTIPSVESLLFRAKQNLQKLLRGFYLSL